MPITAKRLIAVLESLGFTRTRTKGGHYIFRHPDGRRAVVPFHASREIAQPLLGRILREAGLTLEDLHRK